MIANEMQSPWYKINQAREASELTRRRDNIMGGSNVRWKDEVMVKPEMIMLELVTTRVKLRQRLHITYRNTGPSLFSSTPRLSVPRERLSLHAFVDGEPGFAVAGLRYCAAVDSVGYAETGQRSILPDV